MQFVCTKCIIRGHGRHVRWDLKARRVGDRKQTTSDKPVFILYFRVVSVKMSTVRPIAVN